MELGFLKIPTVIEGEFMGIPRNPQESFGIRADSGEFVRNSEGNPAKYPWIFGHFLGFWGTHGVPGILEKCSA